MSWPMPWSFARLRHLMLIKLEMPEEKESFVP